MNNCKFKYFAFVLLLAALFPSQLSIWAQDEDIDLQVSRSENIPGAFDDSLSLNKVVDVLRDRKIKENASIVKKLGKGKVNAMREGDIIKRKIKAAHANPERFNKLTGKADAKPATHAQKAYLLQDLSDNTGKINKIDGKTKSVKQDIHKADRAHEGYGKASKIVGGVGKVLSVYDAYQNSYEKDKDGKQVFSKTKFFKNAVMNLSGLAGLSSAYTKGMEAKEKAFLKALDEYEKAGMDINDPEVICKALTKATGQALLVGTYESAKCIPLAGDAINVYELTESSVGLVHDTLESNRIREENKQEQDRQAGASVSKFKAFLNQAKFCRVLFDKQVSQAKDLAGRFENIRNQYNAVQNRDVRRNEKLADTDKIEKACEIAKPFLEPRYLASLKDNSAELDRAVGVTLKLASTALDNYPKNPDKAPLGNTGKELSDMLKTMVGYKEECDKIVSVFEPLLGGKDVFDQSEALEQAAIEDALISGNLMQNAADLVKLHRSTVQKCQKLQTAQRQIKTKFENAYNYFSIRSKDMAQRKEINDLKDELTGLTINDYELKGLNENADSMAADIKYWHEPIQPSEGMDPELAGIVAKAAETQPDVALLRDSLANRIEEIKTMINRLESPDTPIETVKTPEKTPRLSEREFANISADAICEKIKWMNYVDGKPFPVDANRDVCGFKYYKSNYDQERWQKMFEDFDNQAVPMFSGDFCKLVEHGTTVVWYDRNNNGRRENDEWEKEPYWIWYVTGGGPSMGAQWYYLSDLQKQYEKELNEDSTEVHPFADTNIPKGAIRIKTGDSLTYDKKPFSYRQVNGFAFCPPFKAIIHIRLLCQAGLYSKYHDTTLDDEEFWNKLKEPEEIRKRYEFWSNGIEKQAQELLNETMALPKQFADYSAKHYYLDPSGLLAGINMNGFEEVPHSVVSPTLIRKRYQKTWSYGNNIGGELGYRIHINVRLPDRDESWNELEKRLPKPISHRKNDHAVNLKGASFVRASRIQSESRYSEVGSKKKTVVFHVSEQIDFIKSNVVVEVHCNGNGLPTPETATEAIAQTILDNIKK